jgi:predicted nucleic acid-binding protein
MRFWDSSAVVPMLVEEASTSSVRAAYRRDTAMLVWWGTRVEATSAVSRLERQRKLTEGSAIGALARLGALARSWNEIQPVEEVRETAVRLLRVHDLRAADAYQLAAALLASERQPSTLEFVCLDDRLAAAARREGFTLTLIQEKRNSRS